MMGHSHAMSGTLAWAITAPLTAAATNTELTIPVYLTGIAVTAGAALLPDLDHPSATISRTFGPASQALSVAVHGIFGGHRRGTHTILFALATGIVLYGLVTFFPATTATITCFLTFGLTLRSLHLAPRHGFKGWITITALSVAGTFLALNTVDTWTWLPIAVALGCLTHLGGDGCTKSGVPVLLGMYPLPAPIRRRSYGVDIVGRTGSFVETGILTPAMGIAACGIAWVTLA